MAKRTVQKREVPKFLCNVPEEYAFRFHDGRLLKNMRELEEALRAISDETFRFHANAEKNDFGNWVRDVIGDQKLAADLMNAPTRLQAADSVTARIASLKGR